MSFQEFSFAPDRRSVQNTFYHFSERPSGETNPRSFSTQDPLTYALSKIYETKFAELSKAQRDTLVNILVTDVPLVHHNLTLLAAANYIVYDMRVRVGINDLNPEQFNKYFQVIYQYIIGDVTGKSPEEIQILLANYKVNLLRYIIYVRERTSNFSRTIAASTTST